MKNKWTDFLLVVIMVVLSTLGCSSNQESINKISMKQIQNNKKINNIPAAIVPTEEDLNAILKELEQDTLKEVVHITITEEIPSVFDSKFGGVPYFPTDMELPVDQEGNQLRLLAQIRCEDIKEAEMFPHSGILQFFIADNDLLGLDFDDLTLQNGFRIIYHETIDETIRKEDVQARLVISKTADDYFPVFDENKIKFEITKEGISRTDFRFEEFFVEVYNRRYPRQKIDELDDLGDEVYFTLFENLTGTGHKMGGYPFFTQEDPRSYKKKMDTYDTVLLQIDSDYNSDNVNVMWGDSGVCNFFINEKDLIRNDFSKVAYTWDCY